MGMPVMKESLQQIRLFISSLHIIQRIANKARFEFYVGIYTATNQTTLLQVLANRKTSSNSLTTRIPEAQPTNLVVKLILILLILPQ